MNSNVHVGADESITVKEGFLVKRGHMRHNWKTRWFKLSDASLRYYKSKNDVVPQGRIPLKHAKLSMYNSEHKNDKDREFVMQISTSDGIVYPIQAPSNEELKIWMQFIHDIIEHLDLQNQNQFIPHLPQNIDTMELSTSEILGSYIDAYGDINTESRCVKGQQRSDGFSGIGLRVWLEHSLGLSGEKAEPLVAELLKTGLISLIDDDGSSNTFAAERYYVISNLTEPELPLCESCGENKDVEHFLMKCFDLEQQRQAVPCTLHDLLTVPNIISYMLLILLNPPGVDDSIRRHAMGEEKSLKKVVEQHQPEQRGSITNSRLDDDEYLPPEIRNASDSLSAVLPADLPPGEIVKRGILFKKGHIVQNWKARCFVVQNYPATLSYFDPSKKAPKVLNSLLLRGASVHAVEDMVDGIAAKHLDRRHAFCVDTAEGISYFIMASSYLERQDWLEAIKPLCRKIHGTEKVTSSSGES